MRADRRRRRAAVRRRRLGVAAAMACVVAGIVVFAASDHGRSSPPSSTESSSASSTIPSTTTEPSTVATKGPPYAVGTTSLPLQEQATGGTRSLPTAVRYPAQGVAGTGGAGAAPDRSGGPYPLIVFSQGYDLPPESYAALLERWAAAGFVVADPTYPFTSGPTGLNEADIYNHPADLRFVITSLLQASGTSGSPLSGLIDPHEVAVVGHSDGGDVSLAVAANSCCRDSLVKAAVILSGAEVARFGSYYSSGSVPLLVVQGTADTVNPAVCSVQLYNGDPAPTPKYYVSLLGAQHEPPYLDPGPDQTVVGEVTTDFFEGYLKGNAAALARLTKDGSVPGVATATTAPSLPDPGGTCPQPPPPG